MTIETCSAEETRALGARVALASKLGDVILLHGDLGTGKTTFVQGFVAGLGITDWVNSPTFTIVVDYGAAALVVRHVDLYRLETPGEEFGFDDLSSDAAITLVEWPERAVELLPEEFLLIEFNITSADRRQLCLRALPADGRYAEVVAGLAIGTRPN